MKKQLAEMQAALLYRWKLLDIPVTLKDLTLTSYIRKR